MKLSILDQSVSVKGKSQDQTINDTLKLSLLAEKFGFYRFWVSEHHNHPTIIGTAPPTPKTVIFGLSSFSSGTLRFKTMNFSSYIQS